MEELYKCKCGCNQWMTITPHQYKKDDINNWASFGLRVHAGIAPVLICLNCGFITIPPISMSGKSRVDPNVIAFGDTIKWVEEHNKPKPEHVCNCSKPKTIVYDNHREWDIADQIEDSMGKLDKQTIPTKDDNFNKTKIVNNEPRNKEKPTKTKTKRVSKPKKEGPSRTSKDSTDV